MRGGKNKETEWIKRRNREISKGISKRKQKQMNSEASHTTTDVAKRVKNKLIMKKRKIYMNEGGNAEVKTPINRKIDR